MNQTTVMPIRRETPPVVRLMLPLGNRLRNRYKIERDKWRTILYNYTIIKIYDKQTQRNYTTLAVT